MNQELQAKALDAVNAIAASLQTTAEHVYGVLVKQALVESIAVGALLILGVLLATVLCVVTWRALARYQKDGSYSSDAEGAYAMAFVLCLGAVVAVFIGWGFQLTPVVTGFINPEYAAIQRIFNLVNLNPSQK